MTRLLVATTNPGKVREIRALLADAPVTLLGLNDFPPVPEPEETGATFEENARLKALYYDFHKGSDPGSEQGSDPGSEQGSDPGSERGSDPGSDPILTVAEDSGLVIDALDGEPGIFSARFLRPDATYPERFAEIFRRLAAQPGRPRTARFVCALALVRRGRVLFETTGTVEGEVAEAPRGSGGFGYDPIFRYPPYGATLAEVSDEEKVRVAHRGVAFRALGRWLKEPVQTKNGEP